MSAERPTSSPNVTVLSRKIAVSSFAIGGEWGARRAQRVVLLLSQAGWWRCGTVRRHGRAALPLNDERSLLRERSRNGGREKRVPRRGEHHSRDAGRVSEHGGDTLHAQPCLERP